MVRALLTRFTRYFVPLVVPMSALSTVIHCQDHPLYCPKGNILACPQSSKSVIGSEPFRGDTEPVNYHRPLQLCYAYPNDQEVFGVISIRAARTTLV